MIGNTMKQLRQNHVCVVMNRHMKSHSDKNHQCSRCRKKFNRKVRNLQGYISKHNKTFWVNSIYLYDFKDALNRHMKTHSDKDHECSRCHKTFNRKVCNLQECISKHSKVFWAYNILLILRFSAIWLATRAVRMSPYGPREI
jgi:hypothetical protein